MAWISAACSDEGGDDTPSGGAQSGRSCGNFRRFEPQRGSGRREHGGKTSGGAPQGGGSGGGSSSGGGSQGGSAPSNGGQAGAAAGAAGDGDVPQGGSGGSGATGTAGDANGGSDQPTAGAGPIGPVGGQYPCGRAQLGPNEIINTGGRDFTYLSRQGSRVLSATDKKWILWDAVSGNQVVAAESTSSMATPVLGGNTLVAKTPTGLQLYDAETGQAGAAITTGATQFGVATDGSYVFASSATALEVWSRAGAPIVTRTGNYANAKAFAAASELRIALGAAGSGVIETIDIASKSSSQSPSFLGNFNKWLGDGRRF
ncbi:MAG: hypothetical protein QM756_18860 [Polyangiaceae bacterium]